VSPSDLFKETCISGPELFLTAECLLRAAAEASHISERLDADDESELALAQDLAASAVNNRELAKRVIGDLTRDDEKRDRVFAELMALTRV